MEKIQLAIMAIFVLGIPAFRRIFLFQTSSTIAQKNLEVNVTSQKREAFFDFIRGIAILAVIWIHIVFVLQHFHTEQHNTFLDISNNLLRFALPIFFITSGILLNPLSATKEKLMAFYYKKIIRIIIPYILFNILIALVLNPPNYGFFDFLYSLLTGNLAVPFYFVGVLFQLYLIYPLLVRLNSYCHGVLLVSFLISLMSTLFLKENIGQFIHALPYLFFFVLGWYTRKKCLTGNIKKQELYIWICIATLDLITMGLFFEKYYNIRFFYGTAIFMIIYYFKNVWTKIPWMYHGISLVGKYSLWIFLTHFYIILCTYLVLRIFDLSFAWLTILLFIISSSISVCVSILCGYTYSHIVDLFKSQKDKKPIPQQSL